MRICSRWMSVVLLAAISLLAGCATPVMRSEVLSFHQWPAGVTDRSYQLNRLASQQGSLEHAAYEQVLRNELAAAGFKESTNARFAITMEYSVQTRLSRVNEGPVFMPPVSTSMWLSSGMFRPGWGFSVGVPLGYPYPPYGYDYPVSVRTVKLFVQDQSLKDKPRVWEGTATSTGQSAELISVLPYMLRAMLADFPGQSGTTRRVDVEMADKP